MIGDQRRRNRKLISVQGKSEEKGGRLLSYRKSELTQLQLLKKRYWCFGL
jgi:hypothetical protein